jgi:hypothetical protein
VCIKNESWAIRGVSDERAFDGASRLKFPFLALVPEVDEQVDPVSYAPS